MKHFPLWEEKIEISMKLCRLSSLNLLPLSGAAIGRILVASPPQPLKKDETAAMNLKNIADWWPAEPRTKPRKDVRPITSSGEALRADFPQAQVSSLGGQNGFLSSHRCGPCGNWQGRCWPGDES